MKLRLHKQSLTRERDVALEAVLVIREISSSKPSSILFRRQSPNLWSNQLLKFSWTDLSLHCRVKSLMTSRHGSLWGNRSDRSALDVSRSATIFLLAAGRCRRVSLVYHNDTIIQRATITPEMRNKTNKAQGDGNWFALLASS